MSKTTKTATKSSSAKVTPKQRGDSRAKKIAAKHRVICEEGKPHAKAEPEVDALVKPAGNPLIEAEAGEFAYALNRATIKQLAAALEVKTLTGKKRSHIEAALANRKKIAAAIADGQKAAAESIARTVEAVAKGDLTRGVTIPTADKKKATTPTAPKPEGKMSGLDAAAKVLAESSEPLNCREMVKRMLDAGLWQTGGQTPWATLYSAILRHIRTAGSQVRFRKAERGKFTLTDAGQPAQQAE